MNTPKIINNEKCALFICDLQEKFRTHVLSFDLIIKTAKRMIDVFNILSLPYVLTEQYPQGLGKTISELDVKNAKIVEEKTEFSMLTSKIAKFLEENHIKSIVIMGIEAHICIYQTSIGLLSKGFEVHLLMDGISCRNVNDGIIAVKQLQNMGAILTTSESIIFQLIRDKNHPKFKEVQALVREIIPPNEIMKRI